MLITYGYLILSSCHLHFNGCFPGDQMLAIFHPQFFIPSVSDVSEENLQA